MPFVKYVVCDCWKYPNECKSLSSLTYAWFHHYLRSKGKMFNQDDLFYCKGCTNALYIINKKHLINIASHVSSESSSSDIMSVNEAEMGKSRLLQVTSRIKSLSILSSQVKSSHFHHDLLQYKSQVESFCKILNINSNRVMFCSYQVKSS